MSVTLAIPILRRPYAMLAAPGFPIGVWASHTGLLGDASGGALQLRATFQGASAPAQSLIYNVEEVMILQTDANAGAPLNGLMEVLSMDVLPQNGGTGAQLTWRSFQLTDIGQTRPGQALRGEQFPLPMFLGQPFPNTNSQLLVEVVNAVGRVLSFKCGGYYWQAGAINAIGGPQRPVQSFWGT